jgi:hypothetical protein
MNYGTVTHHLMDALCALELIDPASDHERAQLDQARHRILTSICVVRNTHHRWRLWQTQGET